MSGNQPENFSVLFLTLESDRVTSLKSCFSPQMRHVNHLLGPCQQPKGFNGTVFWDLHMSPVLFERRILSRGKERGKTSLSVKALKGDMTSAERIVVSVLLSFPADTHRCKLTSSVSLPEKFSVSIEGRDRPGCWAIELPGAYSALHIFI